jgi:hypothetical protein
VKNSFKFLTIGLVLALLLVSFVSTNRTASAAPISSISQDTVEWLDSDKNIVKFYSASTTAVFFIADNDLETTPDAVATWASAPTTEAAGGFRMTDGAIDADGAGGSYEFTTAPRTITAVPSTDTLQYSTSSPTTTPIVSGTLTVTDDTVNVLVDSSSLTAGTFSLISAVATGSAVVATYNHHVIDSYAAENAGGTVVTTENRAKVVSTSDSSGEWVTIGEVDDLGSSTADPDAKIFRGSVTLSNDPQATDPDDGNIWVQDEDVLTVIFYKSDHSTSIDSTTATIDATRPAVVNISPADGSIANSVNPTLTFSVTDGGSGLSTAAPASNIEISIVTAGGSCPILDGDDGETAEVIYPSRTAGQLDVNFSPVETTKEWADAPTATCAGRTAGGFGIDTTTLGTNNHGVAFTWKIVATDVAGNSKTLELTDLNLTVDTVRPDLTTATTGKGWNTVTSADKAQVNSIKLVFSEGLDPDTVAADGSDFTVESHSVTGATVAGTDKTTTGGANDKNEWVYLELAADLGSNERPKVELTGAVKDVAGNELKPATGQTVADSISKATDGVKATVSDVNLASTLLAKKGTSKITWSANENITFGSANLSSAVDATECSCISVSGVSATAGTATNKTAVVTTVSASAAEGTFKQTSTLLGSTGIYGAMIVTRDLAANQTVTGATKVSSEDVSSKFTANLAAGVDKAIKLAKWPIADSDGDGTLTDEFTAAINGTTVTTTTVVSIQWTEAETVTMNFSDAVAVGDTVTITYNYVTAAQVIEVDTAAPGITFDPADGTSTEDATPFVSVIFDDDEYAGDTHKTVTLTKATLTDPDGAITDLLAMDDIGDGFGGMATADNITYIYTPAAELALGQYTVTASGTDEAGNTKSLVTGKFTVKARALTTIALRPGWNLISLPNDAASAAINDVINVSAVDTVLTYDPTVSGGWLTAVRDAEGNLAGPLSSIDSTRAYWVHTTTFQSLKVDIPGLAGGAEALPPALVLIKGWNLVPVISLDKSITAIDPDSYFSGLQWSRAYGYNPATGKFTGILPQAPTVADDGVRINTGNGYWVFLREAGDLIP